MIVLIVVLQPMNRKVHQFVKVHVSGCVYCTGAGIVSIHLRVLAHLYIISGHKQGNVWVETHGANSNPNPMFDPNHNQKI